MMPTHEVNIIDPAALEIHQRVSRGESVLKAIRESLGYTQREFAELMDTNVTTVSRWENSGKEPMFRLIQVKALLKELQKIRMSIDNLPDKLSADSSFDE